MGSGVTNYANLEGSFRRRRCQIAPMIFGRIRWDKGMGSPVGDSASGFKVRVEEQTNRSSESAQAVRECYPVPEY
jgi:hypothetical protein